MKYILFFNLIFILQACSSFQNLNEAISGDVSFKGGRHEDYSWSESMTFQRTSFYRGATMAYDVLFHKLERNSPFTKWLDDSEKEHLNRCNTLIIAMFYVESMQPTSSAYLRKEIEKQNFKEILIPGFNQFLKNHPTYQQYYFYSHKITAFCGQSTIGQDKAITMSVPGFNKITVLK